MRYFAPIAAGVAQLVEHLICNQRVGGSSPFAGSMSHLKIAGVVEWLMAPGCKPGGFTPYVGSNPTPCTSPKDEGGRMKDEGASFHPSSFILRPFPEGGSSSVGRASAFQAEGREFEPRLPLQT